MSDDPVIDNVDADGDAEGDDDGDAEVETKKTGPRGPKPKGKKPLRGKKAKEAKKKKVEVAKKESKAAGKDKEEAYCVCTGALESRPRALDVKIGGFTLTAHGQELIKDTAIEFTIGRRYGLIGQNGSGKSTFLRAMSQRLVPIPDHIDIFMLEEEAPKTEMTAVEYVIQEAKNDVIRLEKMLEMYMDELGPDSDLVMDLESRIADIEPSTFEARVSSLLVGLGFGPEMFKKATKDMSGGWRMRVALAQALFIKPTLLLLDEPTNHLDLEACVWLEQYLATYDRCLVVTSHSQDFLNSVCTHIIHITTKCKLQNYSGNYDMFVQTKAELEVNQMKKYKKEQDDIKHIKAFIASCGTYSNLVRQAKSKQKIIDKMEAAGLTEAVDEPPKYVFHFPTCDRLSPPVLSFKDVSFSYSGRKEDYLYSKLDLSVDQDSRIALVGPNGAGKSTLLKLMLQDILPCEGEIRRHLHCSIGTYFQHSAEVLDKDANVLDYMRSRYPDKKMEEKDWRSYCGRFGLSGKFQAAKIGTLSDGLKSRILFAMIAIANPHILLLDEPTNHLDMECIDSLAEAINAYSGGLVLVSHDFRLINQVAKTIWVCDNKTITPWKGDIRSYKNHLIKNMQSTLKTK